MITEFITAESITQFSTIILITTIITELIKEILSVLNVKDLNAKVISFIVGFLVVGSITYIFSGDQLSGTLAQKILLIVINSTMISITANGFYDTINKE